MSLTIITPVLNEAALLPLFLASAAAYADEIIIVDGGSTDGSLELLAQYQKKLPIRLYHRRQSGLPYADWNQPEVRNFMLEQATGDWIANLDADEIFDDRIIEALPALMKQKETDVFQFPFVNFWRDPWTVRVNAEGDARWSNDIVRLWRNGIGVTYRNEKRHTTLQAEGGGSFWKLSRERVDIPLYHYHYALGRRVKVNDNRRGDVNAFDPSAKPDWNYRHGQYEIKTEPFRGKHPKVVADYLAANTGKGAHP